jgi:hypothetical protein
MQSKNKPAQHADERRHVAVLKTMPCACCDTMQDRIDAHEIVQGQWFTSIPLCESCHVGPLLGIHGQKRAWIIRGLSELDALNKTLRRIFSGDHLARRS